MTDPTHANDAFLYEIRCPSCWRLLAVSATQKWGIYCDAFCAQDIPAVKQEARDSVVEALSRDTDIPVAKIGALFGVSRQRAYQMLSGRDLRKAVR